MKPPSSSGEASATCYVLMAHDGAILGLFRALSGGSTQKRVQSQWVEDSGEGPSGLVRLETVTDNFVPLYDYASIVGEELTRAHLGRFGAIWLLGRVLRDVKLSGQGNPAFTGYAVIAHLGALSMTVSEVSKAISLANVGKYHPLYGVRLAIDPSHAAPDVPLGPILAMLRSDSLGRRARTRGALHANPVVRMFAASLADDSHLLSQVVYDPCVMVRIALLANKCCPESAVATLAHDPFPDVGSVMMNYRWREFGDEVPMREPEAHLTSERCSCTPTGIDVSRDVALWSKWGLTLPSATPQHLLSRLQQFGPLNFGTQPFPEGQEASCLYGGDYLAGPLPDQLCVTSTLTVDLISEIHLRLVTGPLAAYVQVRWGGHCGDRTSAVRQWNHQMQELSLTLGLIPEEPAVWQAFRKRPYVVEYTSDEPDPDLPPIGLQVRVSSGYPGDPDIDIRTWEDFRELLRADGYVGST